MPTSSGRLVMRAMKLLATTIAVVWTLKNWESITAEWQDITDMWEG